MRKIIIPIMVLLCAVSMASAQQPQWRDVFVRGGSLNATNVVDVSGSTVAVTNDPAVNINGGTVSVTNDPAVNVNGGTVSVTNTITGTVNGSTVAVTNDPAVNVNGGTVAVTNTITGTVSGSTVAVTNTPNVLASGSTIAVTNTVAILGTVYANQLTTTITITNAATAVNVWTNTTGNSLAIDNVLWTYSADAGTQTGTVDIVFGTTTNRLQDLAMTAVDGGWLPESRVWVENGNILRLGSPNSNAGTSCVIRAQLSR